LNSWTTNNFLRRTLYHWLNSVIIVEVLIWLRVGNLIQNLACVGLGQDYEKQHGNAGLEPPNYSKLVWPNWSFIKYLPQKLEWQKHWAVSNSLYCRPWPFVCEKKLLLPSLCQKWKHVLTGWQPILHYDRAVDEALLCDSSHLFTVFNLFHLYLHIFLYRMCTV
jgi:hypothetical protein